MTLIKDSRAPCSASLALCTASEVHLPAAAEAACRFHISFVNLPTETVQVSPGPVSSGSLLREGPAGLPPVVSRNVEETDPRSHFHLEYLLSLPQAGR